MDQPDRELISALFNRMRTVSVEKDQEAEAFIHGLMRQDANSPYLLVQSVLIQEEALKGADARIRELETEVERLRQNRPAQSAAAKASPGFTGAAASAGPAPWEAAPEPSPTTSVPTTSAARPAAQSAGWWGSGMPAGTTANGSSEAPSAGSTPPPYNGPSSRSGMSVPPAPQDRPSQQSGSGAGGFMRQAASTAAGVAGGMLLANSLSGLFGGGSSASAKPATPATASTDKPAESAANPAEAAQAATTDDSGNGQMQEASDTSDNNQGGHPDQAAMQEASHDDDWGDADDDDNWGSANWGGGDDLEI
jgi:hypothetical protein